MCVRPTVGKHDSHPGKGGEVARVGSDAPAQRAGDVPVHRHRGFDTFGPDARLRLPAGSQRAPAAHPPDRRRCARVPSFSPRVIRSSSRSPTHPPHSSPAPRPSAAWPATIGRRPTPRPRVRMGLHTGYAEPLRRGIREPRGPSGGPGRRRRARRPGALLGRDRRPQRRPRGRGVPARPRPAPAARLRRPRADLPARRAGPGPPVPAPAHGRRARAQPAHAGHPRSSAGAPSGPPCATWSRRTGW